MSYITRLDNDGSRILEENPSSAYSKAQEQGDLAYTIQSLADLREDWASWLHSRLCGLYPEADPSDLGAVLVMARLRLPLTFEKVLQGSQALVLDVQEDRLEELWETGFLQLSEGDPSEVLRFFGDKRQFISTSKWNIPDLEAL